MLIEGKYLGDVLLDDATLKHLGNKGVKKIGLFSSVQFLDSLNKIKKQLEKNDIKAVTSKPKRAHVEGQLLGCDSSPDSLNLKEIVDCFLYIGDGKFHPLALVYGQDKGDLSTLSLTTKLLPQ